MSLHPVTRWAIHLKVWLVHLKPDLSVKNSSATCVPWQYRPEHNVGMVFDVFTAIFHHHCIRPEIDTPLVLALLHPLFQIELGVKMGITATRHALLEIQIQLSQPQTQLYHYHPQATNLIAFGSLLNKKLMTSYCELVNGQELNKTTFSLNEQHLIIHKHTFSS